MKIIQRRPLNGEAPLDALSTIPTPPQHFYVRCNFDIPQLPAETHRLRVTGAVRQPREYSLHDLQRFARREATVLLECAGNGRQRMVPVPEGVAWDLGAVSCAPFSGIALADVLAECGVDDHAVEVLCIGADRGEVSTGRVVAFERSLPIAQALNGGVLLADRMYDAPLTSEHGFPLRVLVPDWYGVASVKWLVELRVLTEPFDGYFQKDRYVYLGDPIESDHAPVREMRVRSIIAAPQDGARLQAGAVRVHGLAWSGHGDIVRVEVSADAGASWKLARLTAPQGRFSPAVWSIDWTARSGEHTLMARAADSAGHLQPMDPIFNQLGYANNVVHTINVTVGGQAGCG